MKLVCNVNIVYGNLKSENSQDYAQKPQRNCMFMNSASVQHNILRIPIRFAYVLWILYRNVCTSTIYTRATYKNVHMYVYIYFLMFCKQFLSKSVKIPPDSYTVLHGLVMFEQ